MRRYRFSGQGGHEGPLLFLEHHLRGETSASAAVSNALPAFKKHKTMDSETVAVDASLSRRASSREENEGSLRPNACARAAVGAFWSG